MNVLKGIAFVIALGLMSYTHAQNAEAKRSFEEWACFYNPELEFCDSGKEPEWQYDDETESRQGCNPFAARADAQEDATDKLEARGYEVYDCDPIAGDDYILWGRQIRGWWYRTTRCPKHTNPNPGLSDLGAMWTIIERCYGRR